MTYNKRLSHSVRVTLLSAITLLLSFSVYGQEYTCPMHPHYIASEPGSCPICGMDLVAMTVEASSKSTQSSRKSVRISAETIQQMGVRTEEAEIASFGTDIRSYGLVEENTRKRYAITGRVSGWIESLSITAVGDEVKEGGLLFTLYSPELVSAMQDYRTALKTSSKGRIRSSQQRLKTLGVSKRSLNTIKKSKQSIENIPFYAESSGVVSALSVQQGDYIKPGSSIAMVQQYDSVWINVSVAEKDLQFISTDTSATVTFPNLGNLSLSVGVDYLHPVIEKSSRTGQVRLVVDNQQGQLRPGAYADVVFESDIDQRLSIPSEAILKSAEGDFVIVKGKEGRFMPQRVQAGIHSKGRTEILNGLKEGDAIVVSGQFLLDSESSLRESFRKLQRAQRPLSLLEVSNDQLAMIDHLIDAALYLHSRQIEGREIRAHMLDPALQLNEHLIPVFRGTKLQVVLENAESALKQVKEAITQSQRHAAMSALVTALRPWILEGNPKHYCKKGLKLYLDHGTGFYWLQLEEKMQHPYGNGHAIEIDIPHSVNLEGLADEVLDDSEDARRPVGGAHAHH